MADLTDERVAQLLSQWGAMGLKDLAVEFKQLKERWVAEKAISTQTNSEFELLSRMVIPKAMEEQGLTKFTADGIGTLRVDNKVSVSQLDKEALFKWLKENGHPDIIKGSVNASTLTSFVKAQVAQGEPIPDLDVIKISSYDVAVITKA